jgi:hypothetical protein
MFLRGLTGSRNGIRGSGRVVDNGFTAARSEGKQQGVTPMGMLKRMKDMRDMVEAAPGMVAQAQQLGAQAQQMAAAQQAAYQVQAGQAVGAQPGGFAEGADFDPIAGVSIEQFASVSKGVAAFGYDPTKLPEIAASKGISASDWQTAHQGWNERIKRNRAVAQRFNQLYRVA